MESRRPLNPSSCPTAMKYGTVTRGICPFRVAGRPISYVFPDAIANWRGFNELDRWFLSFSVQIWFWITCQFLWSMSFFPFWLFLGRHRPKMISA